MKKAIILALLIISIKSVLFSQERGFYIQKFRAYLKNEVNSGPYWQGPITKDTFGLAKIFLDTKDFVLSMSNKVVHAFHYDTGKANFDKDLKAYVIPFCIDRITGETVALVLNSLKVQELVYVGIMSVYEDGTLQLAVYHFQDK